MRPVHHAGQGLFPPQPGGQTLEAAFLFEARANRRDRQARPRRILFQFRVELVLTDRDILAAHIATRRAEDAARLAAEMPVDRKKHKTGKKAKHSKKKAKR